MIERISRWLHDTFDNADINKLIVVFAVGFVFLWFFFREIAPFLGGILIAYLLDGLVQRLERLGIKHTLAVSVVVIITVLLVCLCFYLLPVFLLQLRGVANDMPNVAAVFISLTGKINAFLPAGAALDAEEINSNIGDFVGTAGKFLLDNTLGFAVNLFSLFLYLVLLPLLVFFLLKDKDALLTSGQKYFPISPIFGELWERMDEQFGSYVRGKFLEALIIGFLSWAAFQVFSLNYAFSLAIIVGLSVFVPFVGAIAVTIPVVALAYLQFGTGTDFFWIVGAYAAIQAFDGQLLVPLLFSEVVKLHPVAIFVSIIFFGNLWGVWGVFFAIPLASLIKSVLIVIDARRAV